MVIRWLPTAISFTVSGEMPRVVLSIVIDAPVGSEATDRAPFAKGPKTGMRVTLTTETWFWDTVIFVEYGL